jgi:hypothetical protein
MLHLTGMNTYTTSGRSGRFALSDSTILGALALAAFIQIVVAFGASSNLLNPVQASIAPATNAIMAGPTAGLPSTNSSAVFHSPVTRG